MTDKAQFVTLGVADELFAAPVERVHEILDARPVARLPQAPANLLGMIDVRGEGVPVLDLRLTLGREPAQEVAHLDEVRVQHLRVGDGVALADDRGEAREELGRKRRRPGLHVHVSCPGLGAAARRKRSLIASPSP